MVSAFWLGLHHLCVAETVLFSNVLWVECRYEGCAGFEVVIRAIIVCLDENCNVFVCLVSGPNDSPVIQALLPGNCICGCAIQTLPGSTVIRIT